MARHLTLRRVAIVVVLGSNKTLGRAAAFHPLFKRAVDIISAHPVFQRLPDRTR